MLQRLRHRAQGQEGFTLIELLVVILIIGILAAVAIPTFLSQTSKAYDSNLQSALGTIQTTESSYSTSNGGSFTADPSALTTIEPSLSSPISTYGITVTLSGTTGYTASGTDSKSGVTYKLIYNSQNGSVQKTCSPKNTGACGANSTWGN